MSSFSKKGALMILTFAVTVVVPASVPAADTIVIRAANLEAVADSTLEGKRIGDLLPPTTRSFIRDRGLRMTVGPSKHVSLDPRYRDATKQHTGTVSYDSETHRVHNYRAGTPFPDVSPATHDAGWKVMYNYVYGATMHAVWSSVRHSLTLDNREGLTREKIIALQRYRLYGHLRGPPVVGSGKVFQLFFLRYLRPQGKRGRGLFTIRYVDGRRDDAWAYVTFLGRTRRMSGDFWKHLLTGSQFLYTDLVPPHPSWYENFELVRKTTILASTNNTGDLVNPAGQSPDERYRFVDLSRKPYWAPNPQVITYEPRPVYVVKGTPPEDHRFAASLFYIDAKRNLAYLRIDYDDEGNLWRQCGTYYTPRTGQSGVRAWYGLGKYCVDVQNESSVHGSSDLASARLDPPDARPEDFNLSVLQNPAAYPISLPTNWE